METQRPTRGMICHVCQRPALTMDEARVPYCGRHALMLGGLVRLSRVPEDLTSVPGAGVERSAAISG